MKIDNIIFYRDNDNQTKTVVFYNDGTINKIPYNEGIELLLRYASEKGYTKISELKNDKNLKIWNKETYKKNIFKMVVESDQKAKKVAEQEQEAAKKAKRQKRVRKTPTKPKKEKNKKVGILSLLTLKGKNLLETIKKAVKKKTKKEKPKTTKQEKKPKKTNKKFSFPKRPKEKKTRKNKKERAINVMIGTLIAAIIGTGAFIKKDINKKQQNLDKEIENGLNNENNTETDKASNYNNIYEALYNANMNSTKQKALDSIWKYITCYNNGMSKNHVSKKTSTRLGLRWNEAVAQYLAYNDLSQKAINNIFDTYKFDSNAFIDAYKTGFDQQVLAHTVQIEPLEKNHLIKDKQGKRLYKKYESIIIYYNSNSDDTKKMQYAEKFYKELKEDFDFDENNIKEVENYKLSIMPMIKAMNKMTSNLNLENKLKESEKEYFNKLSSANMIKSKFKNIEKNLTAYQIANQALKEENNEISYKELKRLGIKELKATKAYRVADNSDRNIKDHREYKENTSYEAPSNNSTNTNTNTSTVTANTTSTNKDKKKKEKTKPVKIKDENIDEEEIVTVGIDDDNNKDDDYYYIEPDTNEDVNTQPDDNNDADINDGVIDVTIDGTDAVDTDTPLPDPNNEENDSLITITYINPESINTADNYEVSNNDSISNESVATQDETNEISVDNSVKTYTR